MHLILHFIRFYIKAHFIILSLLFFFVNLEIENTLSKKSTCIHNGIKE